MRSCPNCQSPNHDTAAVCARCGTLLGNYAAPGYPMQPRDRLKRSARRAGIGAGIFLVVAFVTAAFLGGWAAHGLIQTYFGGKEQAVQSSASQDAAENQEVMPDIRGLNVADAKQILADTGVDVAKLQLQERPWGGPAGLVISQDPVVGEAITGQITLTVSSTAAMPDLTGRSQQEAITALRALGVEASVMEEYALAKPTGTVLRSSVKPGDPLPLDVQLVVAQAGASVFLSNIDAVDSSCSTGSYALNGTNYQNSLSCSAGQDKPYTYGWLLNRKAMYLEGTVGVADTEKPGEKVTVTVLGDGRVLGEIPAAYGAPAHLGVDVTGVLRLEVRVQGTANSAVLAETRVKGTVDQVQQLEDN